MSNTPTRSLASLALIACLAIPAASLPAQMNQPAVDAQPIAPDMGAAAAWQALKRLHTRASVC